MVTVERIHATNKEFGIEQLGGLQMWAADVNARGALLCRPAEIVQYDDGSRSAGTVAGFTKLVGQDQVDALVGPYSSALTLKASLVAEKYDIPMVSTAASAGEIWHRGLTKIFGVSYLDDSIALVRALQQEGVKSKMLGFTVGPGLREFADQLGPDAKGVLGVVEWLRSSREPGAQDFAYRFAQKYGYNPGVYAVLGYSAGEILESAIRLAGTTEHNAVREQLRTMYFRPLIGSYRVDETGRQKGRKNFVLQWQNNERKLVAPEELAQSPLIYPMP